MTARFKWAGILFFIISVCFLFYLNGCGNQSKNASEKSMKAATSQVSMLFEQTRPVCFGRFIVEVPTSAIVIYGPTSIEAEIVLLENQAANISEVVAARLVEVKKEIQFLPKYTVAELPLLAKVIDGSVPGQKIIFGANSSAGYGIDSFTPVGKNLFLQHFGPVPPDEDDVPRINKIASNLRFRSESEIPREPGMCIQGGFATIEPKYERAAIGLHFKDYPDIRFSIDAHKNQDYLPINDSPKKLRDKAREKGLALGMSNFFSRVKFLREGTRQVGSWEGEEFATRRPQYKDDTDAHEFRFHSLGLINDAYHPELDIRLETGVKDNTRARVSPSITDEEALALWDRIIATIRLREPSDATSTELASPKIPLGMIERTGNICPQTGMWECLTKQKTIGERKKTVKEGDKMPYVLMDTSTRLFRWISRIWPTEVSTAWKLIAYESNLDAFASPSAVSYPDSNSFK